MHRMQGPTECRRVCTNVAAVAEGPLAQSGARGHGRGCARCTVPRWWRVARGAWRASGLHAFVCVALSPRPPEGVEARPPWLASWRCRWQAATGSWWSGVRAGACRGARPPRPPGERGGAPGEVAGGPPGDSGDRMGPCAPSSSLPRGATVSAWRAAASGAVVSCTPRVRASSGVAQGARLGLRARWFAWPLSAAAVRAGCGPLRPTVWCARRVPTGSRRPTGDRPAWGARWSR